MKAQRGQATSLRPHSSQRRGRPEPSPCPPRGQCAPGLFPGVALTGGLCFRYGSYLVWRELGGFSEEAVVPLGLYAGQLTLNWAWPPIFFGSRQMGVVSASLAPGDGPWRGGPPSGTWASHPDGARAQRQGQRGAQLTAASLPQLRGRRSLVEPPRLPFLQRRSRTGCWLLFRGHRVGQPTACLAPCTPHVVWVRQRQLLPFYIWGN